MDGEHVDQEQEIPNESIIDETLCVKCQSAESSTQKLQEVYRGLNTLIGYAMKIENDHLTNYLQEKKENGCCIKVHQQCQKDAYNVLKRKGSVQPHKDVKLPRVGTRAQQGEDFKWKEKCFFCGGICQEDKKNPTQNQVSFLTTLPFREKILLVCSERDDEWGREVERRVLDCHDLVAADGRYHSKCYRDFVLKAKTSSTTPGRPKETDSHKNFKLVCEWLESEGELYSLKEIHEKMLSLAGGSSVYSEKWLKIKLKEKYHDNIFFAEVNGKSNVVCYRNLADFLINDLWFSKRKDAPGEEAERIVSMAAKSVLSDIRAAKYELDKYPSNEQIEKKQNGLDWLPPYLKLFMQHLFKDQLKQISIGQAIVSAARPYSSIPPVLFGIGVELDHVFGSRWLLTELNKLGVSISSEEVTRYKQSVVENENISSFLKENMQGQFTQYSADNIDHNVRTVDGQKTFHAMGIICSTTDNNTDHSLLNSHQVTRQKRKPVCEIIKNKGIEILSYCNEEESGLSKVFFKDMLQLERPVVLPSDINMDFFWHTYSFAVGSNRPSWSGYMTSTSVGEYPGESVVNILPIIDLDPTNMSCIYLTIKFVIKEAEQLHLQTPILTFDQPLWLKATEIITAKSLSVVLILGGFHLLMSFCGSVGNVMKGSGLKEAWNTIYGANTIEYMISGKAISRALRGHFLAESALTTKLLRHFVTNPMDSEDALLDGNEYFTKLKETADAVFNAPESANELVNNSKVLQELSVKVVAYKDELSESSRTSRLWIQYLNYIDVIKRFIRAARTGNWSLHLETVSRMINLLAATGHIHYAKSARLYLQNMLELPTSYTWVYSSFMEHGYSTVRRSDRYWAGLWTDLVIEQVLMRSLKSRGGLTRGRGITESVSDVVT